MKTDTLSRQATPLQVLPPLAEPCELDLALDIRRVLARRLRTWRARYQVTLKCLAFELGVSVSTVAAWESGARFPGAENLIALARRTGMPVCRFVCRHESCGEALAAIEGPDEVPQRRAVSG